MSIFTNIAPIINDTTKQILGKDNILVTKSDDFVSLGKVLEAKGLYEDYFKTLLNKVVRTIYYSRTYKAKTRSVLRDEHDFGAYVAKVYADLPEAVEAPNYDEKDNEGKLKQKSPWDITNEINISASFFGNRGTWSDEWHTPNARFISAFDDASSMASFIDFLSLTVRNAFELQKEALVNIADNTGIAYALHTGNATNLLAEYNLIAPAPTTVGKCCYDKDFLRFAVNAMANTKDNMSKMSATFSPLNYPTFTESNNLVFEVLSQFSNKADMYLSSDAYHRELVKLPKFESVSFWQGSGKNNFDFADCSTVNLLHKDIDEEAIVQSGIIAVMKDYDYVAGYFGRIKEWSMVNPRAEITNFGINADKGYAVDGHCNCHVFFIAE